MVNFLKYKKEHIILMNKIIIINKILIEKSLRFHFKQIQN
jgi:hypothetical protein